MKYAVYLNFVVEDVNDDDHIEVGSDADMLQHSNLCQAPDYISDDLQKLIAKFTGEDPETKFVTDHEWMDDDEFCISEAGDPVGFFVAGNNVWALVVENPYLGAVI